MTAPLRGQAGAVSDAVPARRFPRLPGDLPALIAVQSLEDYALDPQDPVIAQYYDAFTPLSGRSHYRFELKREGLSHREEFCGLGDGFFVYTNDVLLDAPRTMGFSTPDMLRVRISSEGDGEYAPEGGAPLSLEGPSTTLVIEPPGQPLADMTYAGHNHYVHVLIHRETLKAHYAGSEQELPAVVRAFLDGDLRQTVARTLPVSAALLRCMEELHNCALEGRRRRLFFQSKAVEILCHAFEALEHEDVFGSPEATVVTARSVLKAQQLLSDNFVTPPTLEDLAQQVGLSRSGLCAGFREILGQSVFDYVMDLRMQQALALLNGSEDSITQIAYAVGYNHTSSFTVAVQRRFGATPTELRRRAALPAA